MFNIRIHSIVFHVFLCFVTCFPPNSSFCCKNCCYKDFQEMLWYASWLQGVLLCFVFWELLLYYMYRRSFWTCSIPIKKYQDCWYEFFMVLSTRGRVKNDAIWTELKQRFLYLHSRSPTGVYYLEEVLHPLPYVLRKCSQYTHVHVCLPSTLYSGVPIIRTALICATTISKSFGYVN